MTEAKRDCGDCDSASYVRDEKKPWCEKHSRSVGWQHTCPDWSHRGSTLPTQREPAIKQRQK